MASSFVANLMVGLSEVLWALTESIAPATLQKTHDHNFDEALASLVLDAGRLTKSLPNGMH